MAQISTVSSTEVLAGLVDRVTFHNSDNGFCVLRVKARGQRDLITLVGHAAMISAGEFVQASGSWVNDRTHGVQFKASFLKAAAPTTVEGIEKYLGSGMIRGIGPSVGGLSMTILTGTRCTILTQLPVAFWTGSSENAVPDPGCTLATWPRIVRSG